MEDVDGDGDSDLVLHFSIAGLVTAGAIDAASLQLMLTGETFEGEAVIGFDSVRIVP